MDCRAAFQAARNDEWRDIVANKKPLAIQSYNMTIKFRVIASEAWRSIFKHPHIMLHGLPRGFSSRSQ
jgi:hypothetical protein